MIFRCQQGFEPLLEAELSQSGVACLEKGGGWLRAQGADESILERLCFAHATLLAPTEVTGESVNALAAKIAEYFFNSMREERCEGPWPFLVETSAGLDGLGRRADGVAKALAEILKKRMSRVSKLAVSEAPRGSARARGLFIFFADFQRVFVARECVFGGQRRMADDSQAPSRSYLKIEEAYFVLGREPCSGETVVDLGAAPGGWSYSAAKRGAHVIAVDNGPLKGGALGHPEIEHREADAFAFKPEPGRRYDWLFCDVVEEPHHVMRNLVESWLEGRWCRFFVVTLKFGRVDPIALLREITAPSSGFTKMALNCRIRHLYHNREEFTVVGEVRP